MTPAVNDEREVSETKYTAAEAPKYEHPNWIPPELRRPEDEFVDLTLIEPLFAPQEIDDELQVLTI